MDNKDIKFKEEVKLGDKHFLNAVRKKEEYMNEVKILKEMKYNLENKCIKLMEDNDRLFFENELLKSKLKENELIRHKSHSNNKVLRDLLIKLTDIDDDDVYKYKCVISMYKHSKESGKRMEKEYGIVIPEWMR